MASSIIKMILKLDDKASPALKGVGTEAGKANESFGKMAISGKAIGVGLLAAGVAAIGATKAFMAMGQEYADQINLFNDMSTSTGLSVGALEELNLMSKATGVSLKSMERGLFSFQKSLGEAKDGTGTLTKALDTLGLDPDQFKGTEDAFKTVLTSISVYGEEADRAKLLNEAFGLSAKDMTKVMQTQFGAAAGALDRMNLRLGTSTESAREMQTALALQEITLDALKRKAFDTFLGGGGFVHSMSVVAGVAKGLVRVLEVIVEKIADLAKGVTGVVRAVTLSAQGDFDAAAEAMEDSARFGADVFSGGIMDTTDVVDIMTEAMEAGTKTYDDFSLSMTELNAGAVEQAGLFEALQTEQKGAAKSAEDKAKADAAAAKWARAHAIEVERQAKAAKELQDAYFGAIDALAIFRGEDFDLSIAIDGTKELHTELGRLASEVVGLVEPLTQMEFLLGGVSDMVAGMGLMSGARSEIEQLQESYSDLASLPLGFESEVEHLQEMHVALAKAITMVDLLAQKGEGIPAGVQDMIGLLEDEIMSKTWELEAKVKLSKLPTLEANQLWIDKILADDADIKQLKADKMEAVASAIGTASSTITSLAGGDVAGAAQGLGAALGASPVFGAIVGGLGAIAEIGEMTAKEIRQNTIDFMDNLEKGFEVLVKALPAVIQLLLTRLPAILIDGLFALGEFLLSSELITAIAKGVWEGVQGLIPAIREIFSSDVESAEDMRTSGFGAIVDATRLLLNMKDQKEGGVESFASGSAKISRTGMALLHKGEAVIPAGGRRAMTANGGGGGTVNINISTAIMDRDVIPRLVREIDRAVGKYGRTSAAFAGG